MIDLPTKAKVYCADGIAGRSTYIIGNPNKDEITHTVYLKLDRQSVEELPTAPMQRWSR